MTLTMRAGKYLPIFYDLEMSRLLYCIFSVLFAVRWLIGRTALHSFKRWFIGCYFLTCAVFIGCYIFSRCFIGCNYIMPYGAYASQESYEITQIFNNTSTCRTILLDAVPTAIETDQFSNLCFPASFEVKNGSFFGSQYMTFFRTQHFDQNRPFLEFPSKKITQSQNVTFFESPQKLAIVSIAKSLHKLIFYIFILILTLSIRYEGHRLQNVVSYFYQRCFKIDINKKSVSSEEKRPFTIMELDLSFFEKQNIKMKIPKTCPINLIYVKIKNLLNVKQADAIFLLVNDCQLSADHILLNDYCKVVVIGENKFGSNDSGDHTENVEPDHFGNSEVHKHVITCAYLNSDGHSAEKLKSIELETDRDRDVMITETNFTEKDHARLTANLGDWASIVGDNTYTYKRGKRVVPRGGFKKSGYGTAAVTKDKGAIKLYENLTKSGEKSFEIMALDVKMSETCREGRVVVYRSPSMKDKDEIDEFYDRVERYLDHMTRSKKFNCLTYLGDPNKNAHPKAARREKQVMAKFNMRNLIGDQKTRVRANCETQPDSCYAWFDPSKVVITASVNGKIHQLMDHRLIRIHYLLNGVKPKMREFYEFEREVRDKSLSDDEVNKNLEERLETWMAKYAPLVFKIMEGPKDQWVGYDEHDNIVVSDIIVDEAVDELYDIIEKTKKWMSKKIKLKYPTTISKNANAQEVKIGVLSALLGEISLKIQMFPEDLSWREKFERIEKERIELIKKVSMEHLESKMRFLVDGVKRCSKDYFKITGKMMARDAFTTSCKANVSEEEKSEKLDKNDETFINRDEGFNDDVDEFLNITPDRKFTVAGWQPTREEHFIADALKTIKINKSDYFYKVYSHTLEMPIFIVLRLIEFSEYFPKSMRRSKLTFLDNGRAIFSLEPLTKIVELVLSSEWNNCLQEEYKKNGDPHQMAYEPGRGTTSCNAITFTLCDIVMHETGKPVGQTFADLVKAFNMANRKEMLRQIHKIAGAGKICRSRFLGRVYTFEGETRGHEFNRGVDPGSPISVMLFKLFMNTDISLTSLSEKLMWAAGYSDDRAPIFEYEDYVNGNAQKAWDSSKRWADKMKVKYHMEKDDKKRHTYMAYRRKNMPEPKIFEELKLENIPFERVDNMRELGLNVCTDKSVVGAKSLINKWGYVFRVELARMRASAYRMQDVKNDYPPTFIRQMVMSYFAGVTRFSACLYWTRCIDSEMNTLRYYYGMAAAAILRMNACEVFGLAICKSESVYGNNPDYIKLLKIVGLPTLRDMALTDAVSTVKQVSKIFPEFFSDDDSKERPNVNRCRFLRLERNRNSRNLALRRNTQETFPLKSFDNSKEVSEAGLPSKLSRIVVKSNALIGDVWRLACEKVKQNKKGQFEYRLERYEQLFEVAKRFVRVDSSKFSMVKTCLHYKELCRRELGISEIQERRLAFKSPINKLEANKICTVSPPVWEKPKKDKLKTFNCHTSPPQHSSNAVDENEPVCVICGYNIEFEVNLAGRKNYKMAKCKKCNRGAHEKCSYNLFMSKKSFLCSKILRHLGKGSKEIFSHIMDEPLEKPNFPPRRKEMCLICGSTDGRQKKNNLPCVHRCGFYAHHRCVRALGAITGQNLVNRNLFSCRAVVYQFMPCEIHGITNWPNEKRANLIKRIKQRGKVNTSRYNNRQKRWLNDEIECEHCGRWYGVNETNHVAKYCNGAQGDPITSDNLSYPFAHLKRFKHLTMLVP